MTSQPKPIFSEEEKDILQEIMNIAFGNATADLAEVIDIYVLLSVPDIKVIRSGKVRRAKLYYLRERTGKSARIAEKIKKKIGADVVAKAIKSPELKAEQTAIESKKEAPEKKKSESKEKK